MTGPLNRRGFLHLLGLTTAAVLADPEILVWTPGAKTIFVPPLIERNISLDEINAITKLMIPGMVDLVFRENPLLALFRARAIDIGGPQQ